MKKDICQPTIRVVRTSSVDIITASTVDGTITGQTPNMGIPERRRPSIWD